MRDFTKIGTEQLKRTLRFHENDRGTTTADEECRRMYLVQEIGAELRRPYRVEFPDFAASTMPAIPADWDDISWHNDACPSFQTPNGLRVFVDYSDPAQREFQRHGERFNVQRENENGESDMLLATDDWQQVIAVVLSEAR